MTLTTHAVVGSVLGALASQNLIIAGTIGFSSHFLLDAIPHWDYYLRSSIRTGKSGIDKDMNVFSKPFIIDILKIGLDIAIGMTLAIALFYGAPTVVFTGAIVGAICGILPDALQFVYMKVRTEPFTSLQRFHLFMHARKSLSDKFIYGISLQLAVVLFFAFLTRFLV